MSSESHRAALDRNKENRSRLAFVSATFRVEGGGLAEFEDSVDFGLVYPDKPYVMTGVNFDLDEADLPEGSLPPQVTGFVSEWDQDERGFYTGAWCAAVVTWGAVIIPTDFIFYVDFTFKGIALKDVDPQVRT